jgi:transcriptional regulator with GAF, ATPase, and Fis domain
MPLRNDRIPVWAIWLLIVFATVQPISWMFAGTYPRSSAALPLAIAWVNLLVLGALATRQIRGMRQSLTLEKTAHRATLDEVGHLQLQNEMLQIVASSDNVPQAFTSLAPRIARLVPCDRIGLALLSEDRQEFQTCTVRLEPGDQRPNSRPEVVFSPDGTALGHAVRTCEPLAIEDIGTMPSGYLDVTVLASAGFGSALIVPLVAKGEAIGTLNFVSRQPHGFKLEQSSEVQPMAEILAVAWRSQQLQIALGRFRTVESMSEATLGIATEINSVLQAIAGNCEIMRREYADEHLRRDLDALVIQAERIARLLERMRTAVRDRLERDGGGSFRRGAAH